MATLVATKLQISQVAAVAPIEWLNPDMWKAPAELIGDWRTVAGAGVALATIVGAITKKGRELVSRGWAAVRKRSSQQRGDLRFMPNDRETYWSIGTRGEEKVIMLGGTFNVTNVSHKNVRLLKFRLRGLNARESRSLPHRSEQ